MNDFFAKFGLNGETLVREFLRTGDEAIKEKIVQAYTPLLKYIVGRIGLPSGSALTKDDLYQYGVIGLLKALSNYKPDFGAEFKTYAYKRIQGEIIDALRKEGIVSRDRFQRLRQVELMTNRLLVELGREPLPEEICAELEISEEEYYQALQTAQLHYTVSLEDSFYDEDGNEIYRADNLTDFESSQIEEQLQRTDLKIKLERLISNLPDREKLILALYFSEELTLADIGQVLGLSEARVSQLLNKTLVDLKAKLL